MQSITVSSKVVSLRQIRWQITKKSQDELVQAISANPNCRIDVYLYDAGIINAYLVFLDEVFDKCGVSSFQIIVKPDKFLVWRVYNSTFYKKRILPNKKKVGSKFKCEVGSGKNKKLIELTTSKVNKYLDELGVRSSASEGSLQLGEDFGDDEWANCFKESVDALSGNNAIVVDLTKCEWGDPGPLLSLILQVQKWVSEGRKICVKVRNDVNRFSRFLVGQGFFYQLVKADGRLICVVNENGEPQDVGKYIEKVRRTKLPLRYINQTCIPAYVFKTTENEEEIANELVKAAKKRGLLKSITADSEDPHFSNSIFIVQELRQAISELVSNVRKHAYLEGEFRYGALYARLRHGVADSLCSNRDETQACFSAEHNRRCGFKPCSVEQFGFIELFVSDIGCGFEESLERQGERYRPDNKAQKDINNIFHSLLSRIHRKVEPDALVGEPSRRGLSYICDMLKLRAGYIRIGSSGYWAYWDICEAAPQGFTSKTIDFPEGSHLTVRISKWNSLQLPDKWSTETFHKMIPSDIPSGKTVGDVYKQALQSSIILQSYRAHSFEDMTTIPGFEGLTPLNILCVDDLAVGQLKNAGVRDRDTLVKTRRATLKFSSQYHAILWRPEKNKTRHNLLDSVKNLSLKYPNCPCLIIADQDLSHSLLTLSVFENVPAESVGNFYNIIILSSNYSHVELVIDYKCRLLRVNTRRNSFSSYVKELTFAHIVHAFKRIDANFFHLAIVSDKSSRPYLVAGPIKWDKDVDMRHYIDFSATLKNEICTWIYKRSLARFLAYCSISERPYPTDHHVEELIGNFNFYNNDMVVDNPIVIKDSKLSVILSSVVVTGRTIDSGELLRKERDKAHLYCFYFRSAVAQLEKFESPYNNFYLLRWTSELEDYVAQRGQWTSIRSGLSEETEYTHLRITDSPSIGKIGNKEWHFIRAYPQSFINPLSDPAARTELSEDRESTLYIYGNSPYRPTGMGPREVYDYWQEHDCIKFGHWSASGHHDCIGVRHLDPLQRDSVEPVGESWRYVRSHLDRVFLRSDKQDTFEDCDLLVCMAGEVSQFIASEIRGNENYQLEANRTGVPIADRVCILSTVKGHRSATRLRINPLDLDELTQKVHAILGADSPLVDQEGVPANDDGNMVSKIKILLFVPSITSIRSLLEMREAIFSAAPDQIEKIRTFSLLDRTRMPNTLEQVTGVSRKVDAIGGVFWPAKHSRLWRLDIDCLAAAPQGVVHSQGCPLCRARQNVERLQQSVDNTLVQKRLDEVCFHLLPRRINGYKMEHRELRFDLSDIVDTSPKMILQRQNREDSNPLTEKINIRNSSAIACLLVELMTVSGDYLLVEKWIDKIDSVLEGADVEEDIRQRLIKTKIEIIVAIVLYFRMDMDDSRRFYLLSKLLVSMCEASEPSRITAFGLGVISLTDIDLATRLVEFLCESRRVEDADSKEERSLEVEKPLIEHISNLDFHLANSILLQRGDQDEIFKSSSSKTMQPRLRSESNLLSEQHHSFTSQLITIFGELGYREGERHKTYLEGYLEWFRGDYVMDQEVPLRLRASIIKVCNALNRLGDMSADLPRDFDFDGFAEMIAKTQKALDDNSSVACWKVLYDKGAGLLAFMKKELLFDYESMYFVWNDLVNGNAEIPHYICEIYGSLDDVVDVQSFYTGNTHELIREYVINAKKHFDEDKGDSVREPWVHFIVSVDNEASLKSRHRVKITIRSAFYLSEPSKDYRETVNVAILQQQGGDIEWPIYKEGDYYEVSLFLPTLNTMHERGAR